MIKMVISDMDGTLLNSDLEISIENLQAIKALRQKGIRFCIATGRPEQLLKEYIEPLQMIDPMIMYNGSVIGHPFREKNIYQLKLKNDDIRSIVAYCEQHNVTYMSYSKSKLISRPNYRVDFFEQRNKKLNDKNRVIFEDIRDINKVVNENDISKILIIENNPKKNKEVIVFLKNYPQLEIAASQQGFIDINPKGASKGNALKILADYFGYILDEIVVFGDQDNDVSMLEVAGIGVSMANASEKARNASTDTTSSNNDSGVAKWITKNLL